MQELKVYQSLWAMERRIPGKPERTPQESFRKIADAGYDGVCIDPSPADIDDSLALKPLYEEFGLECMVNAFPSTVEDMTSLYALASAMDAKLVNIVGGVTPIKPEDAVPVVKQWLLEAGNVPVLFETHRDSLLNDLFFTLLLMDLVPEMRLCADLSHFVIDREMREPVSERDRQYIERILDRSDCLQGRIAGREQIQLQIDFPQHQEWVSIFKDWWKEGMQRWRDNNRDDAVLIFLCELGPPPYAMTGADQLELSDRWDEALTIRRWAQEIWADLQAS